MKKLLFILLILAGTSIYNKSHAQAFIDQDLEIRVEKDTLVINILDKSVKSGDILIYQNFDHVKINSTFSGNPIKLYIGNWDKNTYQIKLDYGLFSQFRHFTI